MSSTKHIGHQVIAMMDRLGVSPLTRNYHLFYICIANSNPLIRRAVRNLGMHPSQDQLDQVIEEFCPEAVDSYMMHRHENAVLRAIDDLASRLRSEQMEMSNFNNAIDRVSSALAKSAEQEKVTVDLLLNVVSAIGDAGKRRVASGHRVLKRMDENRTEVNALKSELAKVRKMANTDALTGLANRRNFDEKLAAAIGKLSDFALILADIDHFKRINDAYGHAFGDHVLKTVAVTIGHAMREGVFLARTGGEEFAILLPKVKEQEAMVIAERVRMAVERIKLRKGEEEVSVTISLGAALSRFAETPNQLYEAADAALYRSKNGGRNRATLHDPSEDTSTSNRYQIYAR